jgi:hypothetical protein
MKAAAIYLVEEDITCGFSFSLTMLRASVVLSIRLSHRAERSGGQGAKGRGVFVLAREQSRLPGRRGVNSFFFSFPSFLLRLFFFSLRISLIPLPFLLHLFSPHTTFLYMAATESGLLERHGTSLAPGGRGLLVEALIFGLWDVLMCGKWGLFRT